MIDPTTFEKLREESLRQGADIMAVACRHGSVVVLCHLPHNPITPYVTWKARADMASGFYTGNYRRTEEEGWSNFSERVKIMS